VNGASRRKLLAASGAGALIAAGVRGTYAARNAQAPGVARADLPRASDKLPVRAAPAGEETITRLPQDAHVRVTGEVTGPDGGRWYAIRLWNALDGYVPSEALSFSPAPLKPANTGGAAPWEPEVPPAQGPFPLFAHGGLRAAAAFAAEPDGPALGRIAADTPVNVRAYATDTQTRMWVQVDPAPGAPSGGWLLADRFTPAGPDPLTATASGEVLANRLRGTGMWCTYDLLRETPTRHIIATARANGFSFLAPQVGTSRRGYWASAEYDALLPAAHDAGLKVIPWVYTWLVDLPGDMQLAATALRHISPSGDVPDGLGIDIEENIAETPVRAFGQLLRALVGHESLLAAITYQPQNANGRRTPFGAIAESFNVIAPMAYWHLRPIPYSERDAYDYVAESVRLIRERTGRRDAPVAVIGQTFDWFSRNEIGQHNPSGAEVRGSIRAVQDTGALGIGYFNWFSTVPDEWDAIRESYAL